MGRYWKPEGNIVRIIPVGERWDRRPSGGGGSGPWLITLLLGAVFAGLVGALVWQQWDVRTPPIDTSEIEWNEVQPVSLPLEWAASTAARMASACVSNG